MKNLKHEIKMYIAERLCGWAISMLNPKGQDDERLLFSSIMEYFILISQNDK